MGVLELKYIIIVNNINRCKEKEKCKKLKNKFLEVFITKKENNMQNIYIQDNKKKLNQLAKQANYIKIDRREASKLVYKVSTINSREAIKNIKVILTY